MNLDAALGHAKRLLLALEMIYAARTRGEEPRASDLRRLERLIEDAATHPALADAASFRKDGR